MEGTNCTLTRNELRIIAKAEMLILDATTSPTLSKP